eukprot:4500962-Pyramimonas_sp.AAC.1
MTPVVAARPPRQHARQRDLLKFVFSLYGRIHPVPSTYRSLAFPARLRRRLADSNTILRAAVACTCR